MGLIDRIRRATRAELIVGIAVISGATVGSLLAPKNPTPSDPRPPPPEVNLLGQPLPVDDRAPKLALERVRQFAAQRLELGIPGEPSRGISLGRLGAQIDKVHLAQLVRDARDATSPLRRTWLRRGRTEPIELPVPIVLGPEAALPVLLALKDELDRAPVDARFDLEARRVVAEVDGRLLDVDRTLGSIQDAVTRGSRTAMVMFESMHPKRLASELGRVKFDAAIGSFETRYDRSERYRARTFNLRLAASKLDGRVLLPGEVFDFNEVVGPRDEANGYRVAPVIAEGELVDGIGGGTCQISGTLHGAAFFAGLDIVERYPHTRPSGYIKMGLDATVVYPTINLRVRNPYEFPVVLHETVKNGWVRAEVLGPERTRTVTLIRRILGTMPYEQVERPDDEISAGERVLGQRGVAGFKLRRYRIVREGAHARRERWDEVYPPTTQIIRVGTGRGATGRERPSDDTHPEYLADELLIVTQGPDRDDSEPAAQQNGQTLEWREPGKYGRAGWTAAEGMPLWRGEDDEEQRSAETSSSETRKRRED
ncbi:MAG: VanW family protein [Polyangiaceae bacterium]|nr:VanW family protein [Polyangiaceae bacterium]